MDKIFQRLKEKKELVEAYLFGVIVGLFIGLAITLGVFTYFIRQT